MPCLLTQIKQHVASGSQKPQLPLSLRCDGFRKHNWKHMRNDTQPLVVLIMRFHRPAREVFRLSLQTSVYVYGLLKAVPEWQWQVPTRILGPGQKLHETMHRIWDNRMNEFLQLLVRSPSCPRQRGTLWKLTRGLPEQLFQNHHCPLWGISS